MTDPIEPDLTTIYDLVGAPRGRGGAFDPSLSPLHDRVVFVVGAPRSGTTWLQQLLAVHPDVATSGENHLFCEGLDAIFANHADADPTMMLSSWVNEAELLSLCRALSDGVLATMRDGTRPDATRILDKTPNHRRQSRLQASLYPDARYVHIVRDGRDASASAYELWKRFSAEYSSVEGTVAAWRDAVEDIREHLSHLHYVEVRYEELLDDVPRGLARILDHLSLRYDDDFLEAAADFGRSPINVSPASPAIGQRKRAGDFRIDRAVALEAGELMVDLGYLSPSERSEIESLRSPATMRHDAMSQIARTWAAAPSAVASMIARARRHRWRSATAGVRRVAREVGAGIARHDAEAIRALCEGAMDADRVTALINELGGSEPVSTKIEPHAAAITLVRDDGTRRLLRVTERRDRLTGLELL